MDFYTPQASTTPIIQVYNLIRLSNSMRIHILPDDWLLQYRLALQAKVPWKNLWPAVQKIFEVS